ncbi:DUF4142 domain-containing protein [Mesorhizobium sp. M0437]|uniref:DUF4142 domain-containing protein n=1 Tax=Mesorhizobium sp. M0437 TaxID=2956945 RepID=UPI003338E4AF
MMAQPDPPAARDDLERDPREPAAENRAERPRDRRQRWDGSDISPTQPLLTHPRRLCSEPGQGRCALRVLAIQKLRRRGTANRYIDGGDRRPAVVAGGALDEWRVLRRQAVLRLANDLHGSFARSPTNSRRPAGTVSNRKYIDMQTQAHKEAVALFSAYANSGDDPAMKEFAKKTLPVLQMHERHVKDLAAAHQ